MSPLSISFVSVLYSIDYYLSFLDLKQHTVITDSHPILWCKVCEPFNIPNKPLLKTHDLFDYSPCFQFRNAFKIFDRYGLQFNLIHILFLRSLCFSGITDKEA